MVHRALKETRDISVPPVHRVVKVLLVTRVIQV